MSTTKLMTAEDLWNLPDDGKKYELTHGILVEIMPPGGEHGEISTELLWHLRTYLAQHPIGRAYVGDTGFILARNPDIVRGPDVAFVRAERLPPRDQRTGYLPLAPDLAVEVVSPSDRWRKVLEKVSDYLDAGTPLVWVVLPARRLVNVYRADGTVQTLREGDSLDGEDVLPGFRLPVADIFR